MEDHSTFKVTYRNNNFHAYVECAVCGIKAVFKGSRWKPATNTYATYKLWRWEYTGKNVGAPTIDPPNWLTLDDIPPTDFHLVVSILNQM